MELEGEETDHNEDSAITDHYLHWAEEEPRRIKPHLWGLNPFCVVIEIL